MPFRRAGTTIRLNKLTKIGRPSKCTPALIERMQDIISRPEIRMFKQLLAAPGMPAETNFYKWVFKEGAQYETFRQFLTRARKILALKYSDELVEIGDDDKKDVIYDDVLDENGNVKKRIAKSDNTGVNRGRLRSENRKYLMGKFDKELFGEHQKVEQKTDISVTYTQLVDRPPAETPEQWERRVQREISERAKKLQE